MKASITLNEDNSQTIDQEKDTKKQWMTPKMEILVINLDSGANMDGPDFENS